MEAALLIMVREGFDAALVVAIVFAYLRKLGRLDLSRAVWGGVVAAVAVSVTVGLVVRATVGELDGTARLHALVGGLVGRALASVLAYAVYWGGRSIPMRAFFKVTGLVLIVFAAGLVAKTVMFLQVSGDIGSLSLNGVYDLTSYRWLTQDTEVGKFLSAMFGWDPRPSVEQVVAWVAFLVPVTILFLRPAPAPRPAVERTP